MGYIVRMPKLGMEMKQGTLLEWLFDEGDVVAEGEVIAEIESEKTTAEVEAREDGMLRRTYLEPGETVEPGDPIAIVAGAEEDLADLEAEAGVATDREGESGSAGDGEAAASAADAEAERSRESEDGEDADGADEGGAERADADSTAVKASPRARQRAEELEVDLTGLEGTGPGGAVTAEDVEAAAAATPTGGEAGETDGPAPLTIREERTLDGMRQTIAKRLGQSYREAVHVTEHRTADAGALLAAADAAEDALGVDVSVPDVLLVAVASTLEEHPAFNARYEEDVHVLYDEQNVGIAVDIGDGLIAPVIPDVGERTLEEVATTRRELTRRALDGEYTMDDLANGTFTVTNLGVLGVEAFNPVINPPQIAILGVDALTEAVVPDGEGGVTVRPRLPLDLSFDHRIVDGADAARFLDTLVGHLEDPWPLLPEEVRAAAGPESGEGEETTMPGRSVTARLEEGLAGTVRAGSFRVPFDEPTAVGGSETGPTPVDLFLGSLAACLLESLRYQAVEKRDVELEDATVVAEAEPERGPVEGLSVTVEVASPADDETVDRLVKMAERGCHVSQLIDESVTFELTWRRA